jgi:hypothetical protein
VCVAVDAAIVALRADSSVVAHAFLLCTFCFLFLFFTERGISITCNDFLCEDADVES